ncbi:tyrosine-protein phosphatase [Desulfuromonas sp. TF]|uniref:phosphatase domain-containing putative toxin n=1 Tax=Desulfuromonas sp. TF TaxID=1232410 RepID=UPI001D04E41E|nr:tyrosine-protein phosphatase [Desulfuromonas sp. TF]
MELLRSLTRLLLRPMTPVLLAAMLLTGSATFAATEIHPFSSDGCSLFPDGTLNDRTRWCDCCFSHDMAYWQGGSEAERLATDEALRGCVQERTGDATLAQAMYLGVRAGGIPAFPAWYRWGYGWDYGRGYKELNAIEKEQVKRQLQAYAEDHPQNYCQDDQAEQDGRPSAWASPLPSAQLKNFYRLDSKVYRAAQPSAVGFAELKALGISNVLNLREHHIDSGEETAGMNLFRVPMAAGSVTTDQVIAALRIISNSDGPILIHCWHGSDRTGLVSAMYRIVFQGWEKEAAILELTDGGYGYHAFFYGNIPKLIRAADIAAIRKAVLAPEIKQQDKTAVSGLLLDIK